MVLHYCYCSTVLVFSLLFCFLSGLSPFRLFIRALLLSFQLLFSSDIFFYLILSSSSLSSLFLIFFFSFLASSVFPQCSFGLLILWVFYCFFLLSLHHLSFSFFISLPSIVIVLVFILLSSANKICVQSFLFSHLHHHIPLDRLMLILTITTHSIIIIMIIVLDSISVSLIFFFLFLIICSSIMI